MNPDCRDGKHDACNGDGWDGEQEISCPCACHIDFLKHKAAVDEMLKRINGEV